VISKPLRQSFVGTVQYGMFIPLELLKRNGLRKNASDKVLLEKLPWVTLGSDGEFMRQVTLACSENEIRLNFKLITQSFPQAARAVRRGAYAAILPLHSQFIFERGEIFFRETAILQPCSRKIVLGWNPKMLSYRPGAEQVLSFLKEHLNFGA